ncbi:MAG: hypothetical protein R3A10_08325 [Caldilineaceae bacterium]
MAELGIGRANIALIYGLATLGASLFLPVTGRLTDRFGAAGHHRSGGVVGRGLLSWAWSAASSRCCWACCCCALPASARYSSSATT